MIKLQKLYILIKSKEINGFGPSSIRNFGTDVAMESI